MLGSKSIPVGKQEIYSKKISWIRQDCCIAVKVDYYDKLNKLHRSFYASQISEIQGFWCVLHMEMKNIQTGHRTLLSISDPRFNVKIEPNLFTVSKLEKGI